MGNSLGIVLPREALHTLKVEEGANLYLTGEPEGLLRISHKIGTGSTGLGVCRRNPTDS